MDLKVGYRRRRNEPDIFYSPTTWVSLYGNARHSCSNEIAEGSTYRASIAYIWIAFSWLQRSSLFAWQRSYREAFNRIVYCMPPHCQHVCISKRDWVANIRTRSKKFRVHRVWWIRELLLPKLIIQKRVQIMTTIRRVRQREKGHHNLITTPNRTQIRRNQSFSWVTWSHIQIRARCWSFSDRWKWSTQLRHVSHLLKERIHSGANSMNISYHSAM